MAQLQVREMSYAYQNNPVLERVSFAISPGEIVGLLGINGAGKSTLFKLISGLFCLQKGAVFFNDTLVSRPGFCVTSFMRAQMGVVFQECSLDAKLSAKANLFLSGSLYGFARLSISQKIETELEEFGLGKVAHHAVKTFSGGMKRKLELIRAMLHEPAFLLMDEPSAGLDQEAFHRFWNKLFLNKETRSQTTLIATHRVEEAEKCDRLLVLHGGKLIASESPSEFTNRVQGDLVCLRFFKSAHVEQKQNWLKTLQHHFSDLKIEFLDDEMTVMTPHGYQLVPRLVEILPPSAVESVYVRRPTLADAFLKVTGVRL